MACQSGDRSGRRAQLEALIAALQEELAQLPPEPPPAPAPTPAYMTPEEFSRHVRLTPGTIRQMAREGLPHVRPRKRVIRIKVAEAEAWMARRPDAAARSAVLDARKGHLQ